ncbi:MAG TPA: hypothetical protein VFM90_08045, partial [Cyclobacteriaceae bacterium]|nr:hypothetical protein [Cyclobacteriaceae bacterium]
KYDNLIGYFFKSRIQFDECHPYFTPSGQSCNVTSTGNNLYGDRRFLTIIALLVRILSQIFLA